MTVARWIKGLVTSAAILALGLPGPARAAEPYEIDAILALTGNGTFIGAAQWEAIQIAETVINTKGGIDGRPVKFIAKDDQSNPQVAIQLMQALIAQKTPLVLGPSLTASCNAIMPLVAAAGPVSYCLTAGAKPAPGGYVFSTLTSTPDLIAVAMRYLREKGFRTFAYIVTSDASGQDAEQGILADAALPENKGLQLVDAEHLAPADISISAQLAKIQAAHPDALLAWATGTAGGTVLRGLHDAGYTVPTLLSSANMTAPFMKQYGALYTDEMVLPAMAYYGGPSLVDPRTRAAMQQMTDAFRAVGKIPDQVSISAWDPTMFVVDVLKKVGLDASAPKIRAAMVGAKGWVGVNGVYDYPSYAQRGIGRNVIVMVRWDPARGEFVPMSKLGGQPLAAR